MHQDLFTLLLTCLEPKTLTYLARDLENSRTDWQHYPERAPERATQMEIEAVIESVVKLGAKITAGGQPAFLQMVEQARGEQEAEENWAYERDQQEVQNWLKDYE